MRERGGGRERVGKEAEESREEREGGGGARVSKREGGREGGE